MAVCSKSLIPDRAIVGLVVVLAVLRITAKCIQAFLYAVLGLEAWRALFKVGFHSFTLIAAGEQAEL